MFEALLTLDRILVRAFRVVSVALLCLLFVLMSMNVIIRFFPVFSMGWFDEIVELSFAWIVFTTAALLWRNKLHPKIDLLEALLQGRSRYALLSLIECINIFFLGAFTYYSASLVAKAGASSPIFQIPRKLFYIVMPMVGVYMMIVSVFFLAGYLLLLAGRDETQSPSAN